MCPSTVVFVNKEKCERGGCLTPPGTGGIIPKNISGIHIVLASEE